MKVIGLGAAGNKAVVSAVQEGILSQDDVLIMNSTKRDFPKDFEAKCCVLLSDVGGCGKERNIGKAVIERFLSKMENKQKLADFFPETETHVVLCTSMGGGTGSGATNMLGQFFKHNLDLDVTIIAFQGFSEDVRELQNNVEFLSELDDSFTVQIIRNDAFLKDSNGNKVKAEQKANKEFCKRILFLQGRKLIPSDQNIDKTDLYKLKTMSGFQDIIYTEFDKVKNNETMEKILKDALDSSPSPETVPSAKIMGVMLQMKPDTVDTFDFSYKQLKQRYGEMYEVYVHIQQPHEKDDTEWLAVIVSGAKLPLETLKAMYKEYEERTKNVDKSDDNFVALANQMEIRKEDDMFSRGMRRTRNVNLEAASGGFVGGLKKRNVNLDQPIQSNGKVNMEKVKEKF